MLVLSLTLSSSNIDVLEKSQYLSAVFSCTAKRKEKKNKKHPQSLECHSVAEIYTAAT